MTNNWHLSPLFTEHGMTDNNGSVIILAGDAGDPYPVAHALLTVEAKRGQKHTVQDPVRDANARLIAAAPELLATLKMLVTEVQSIDRAPGSLTPHMADAMNWAYSAIAKAEG
jgi:hypothetical protein